MAEYTEFRTFTDYDIFDCDQHLYEPADCLRRMDKMRGMGRNGRWIGGPLAERPSETFKRSFRVVPYWEDDLVPLIEQVGRDVLVGGSDFPHSEGLAFPTQLVEHLEGFSPEDQRFILRDNARSLVGLR